MFSFQSSFLLSVQCVCRQCGRAFVPLNTVSLIGMNTNKVSGVFSQYFCSKECSDGYENKVITPYRERTEQWG